MAPGARGLADESNMRFVRYVTVQSITYGLDLGLFLVMFMLVGWGAVIANVFSKVCGGVFGYLAHRHFTFETARHGQLGRQALLYAGLWVLNVPLANGLLATFLLFDIPAIVAKIVSDVFCVGINYWLSRTYIFTGHRRC